MNTKKIIIGGVGLAGLAALAFYFYQRSQGAAVNVSDGVSYNATTGQQVSANAYPNKATVLRVAQENWPDYFNDLNTSYNPQDGTATHGDWKIKVVGNSPLTLQFNKGATETFKLKQGSGTAFDQLKGFELNLLR